MEPTLASQTQEVIQEVAPLVADLESRAASLLRTSALTLERDLVAWTSEARPDLAMRIVEELRDLYQVTYNLRFSSSLTPEQRTRRAALQEGSWSHYLKWRSLITRRMGAAD